MPMLRTTLLALWGLAATPGCHAPNEVVPSPIYATGFDDFNEVMTLDRVRQKQNLAIVRDPVDPSNAVLRVVVNRGDHYGASFHVDLKKRIGHDPTRLFVRYRIWFDSTWTPVFGGKLPGFNGTYARAGWGGRPSDGTNGWSARGMFGAMDDDGRIPIGSYIYHADMINTAQVYGNSEWWDATLDRERWHVVEQEIQLESVDTDGGRADGWIRAWVNGKQVFDRDGLHVRDTDELGIESVWVNVYYGGKTPAATNMSLLIDDLWVAHDKPR